MQIWVILEKRSKDLGWTLLEEYYISGESCQKEWNKLREEFAQYGIEFKTQRLSPGVRGESL